jgi:hypothetical protein
MSQVTESLVITAAEYKTILTLNNGQTYIILTPLGISMSTTRSEESIYAIGQNEPIANKRTETKYTGSLELQVGEWGTILKAAGLVEGTQVENANLAILSLNPLGIQRVYNGLNINDEGIDVKAKDKDSKVSLKWTAVSVTSIAA